MSMQHEQPVQSSTPIGPDLAVSSVTKRPRATSTISWLERSAQGIFIWPSLLVLLCFSIFPLIISLYLSFSRFKFVHGGYDISFVGLANYRKLLFGSEQEHFLGVLAWPSFLGWLVFAGVVLLVFYGLGRFVKGSRHSVVDVVLRCALALLLIALSWLLVSTLTGGGRPGTVVVTLVYVYVGIMFQYLIGLGLALLTAQPLAGRRFFRVVFLLPMMITPVGVAYLFRMLADTDKGPFTPFWQAIGWGGFSWVTQPWGARSAVIIGDVWEWTPFMFIVLLAALESQPAEPMEAALVDGANRWQIFRHLTLPHILPVSTAVVLIRMIEAYKIIDLPNVLTNGGPGTATESMTLQAFITWRTLDLGGSAAIAYILLLLVTVVSVAFVNLIRRATTEMV
jgi:multiple sugar transport system permease protein